MVVVGLIAVVLTLALPNLFKSRDTAQVTSCIANLKAIDSAKQQWAVNEKQDGTAEPVGTDLFGSDKFIKMKPLCPAGGTYSLNPVSIKPTCTISGHVL